MVEILKLIYVNIIFAVFGYFIPVRIINDISFVFRGVTRQWGIFGYYKAWGKPNIVQLIFLPISYYIYFIVIKYLYINYALNNNLNIELGLILGVLFGIKAAINDWKTLPMSIVKK